MSQINLLPWRDELREQRKRQFIVTLIASALFAVLAVLLAWSYFAYKLKDQREANQLIISRNQDLDKQLKKIESLQVQRTAIIERMRLIQGLQGQRPITVRLIDELVRVVPAAMYLTKFSRIGDQITIEGQADNPDTVAILLRGLELSQWYRNAFMSSFLNTEESKTQQPSSTLPRAEAAYGHFIVTVDIAEIGSTAVISSAPVTVKGAG